MSRRKVVLLVATGLTIGLQLVVVWRLGLSRVDEGQSRPAVLALVSGDLVDVYPSDTTSTSPPGGLMVAATIVTLLRPFSSAGAAYGIATVCALVAIPLAVAVAAARLGAPTPNVVLATVICGLAPPVYTSITEFHHPQDLWAVTALLVAIALRDTHPVGACLFVGFAVLTRQWAVLPLLAVAGAIGWSKAWRACAVACVVLVVGTLPFAVVSPMGVMRAITGGPVLVMGYTPVGLALTSAGAIAVARLAPMAVAGVAGRLARGAGSTSSAALCALAAVGLSARVLFDVAAYMYYWAPVVVAVAMTEVTRRPPWLSFVVAGGVYALFIGPEGMLQPEWPFALGFLVLAVGAGAAGARAVRQSHHLSPSGS